MYKRQVLDPEANIIVGAVIDESMESEIAITVIVTGFNSTPPDTNQSFRRRIGKVQIALFTIVLITKKEEQIFLNS